MLRIPTSPRRLLAAIATVALVAAGSGTAHAQTAAPPAPVPIDSFCAEVPDAFDPFEDVTGGTFEAHIRCLAFAGITEGVGPGSATDPRAAFDPAAAVTRQQMAGFIVRLIDTAHDLAIDDAVNELPPFDGVHQFQDVIDENPHFASINRLAAAGIALGGPGELDEDQFAPLQAVSRGQMASFIHRAHQFILGAPFEADSSYFTDTSGNVHEASIDALAALGISVGFPDRTYQPAATITRAQMSGFLARTLASMHAAGHIAPVPAKVTVEVFFLRGEQLEAELRWVDAVAPGSRAVEGLLAGPQDAELFTAIPAGTVLLGLDIADQIATVDLSGDFETGGGTLSARARVAQVVFTLTQFETVDGVLFQIDGEPRTHVTSEGIDVTDPLDRSHFADLVA
jgi:hypothetical protein